MANVIILAKMFELFLRQIPKHLYICLLFEFVFFSVCLQSTVDYNSALNCTHICETSDKCLTSDQICDLIADCPKGDDETQSCGNSLTDILIN